MNGFKEEVVEEWVIILLKGFCVGILFLTQPNNWIEWKDRVEWKKERKRVE
jgi:hypothetical protein